MEISELRLANTPEVSDRPLCVHCRFFWSSSCCRLALPSDTLTGSSRSATPPGTSTTLKTTVLRIAASLTSGDISLF